MGFGTLEQLIAKGRPSPITSALKGFQTGAGIMPGIKMAQLAPALRQAQIQQALAKARQPFAGQHLIGPAGEAFSDIQFKQRFGNDPEKMALLQNAHERKMRMANARTFGMLPSAERGRWVAQARTMGYTSNEALSYALRGYNLGDLLRWSKAGKKPPLQTEIPTVPAPEAIPGAPPGATTANHPAENFSNAHLADANAEIDRNTSPINANEIKPTYPAQTGVITAQQKATAATAGMDYLGQQVKQGLNYGGLFSVVTRPWYWDARSKDPANQEKAVKYYAAHALKPELALYRVRIQQGQASARIVRELSPTILGSVKTDLKFLPAEIQKRIQQRVMDVLNEATAASSRQVTGATPTTFTPSRIAQQPAKTAPSLIKASDGRSYSREELRKIAQGGK